MLLLGAPVFALTLFADPAGGNQPAPSLEARAIQALAEGDRAALRSLAAEYRRLPPEARRDLPLRVREDAVEFAFRGEFAGQNFSAEMLEYLASGPGKDYESLLVVPPSELERVQALRPIFAKRAGEGRRKWWSARLLWTEGGAPQSVELGDLLIRLGEDERNRFLDQLGVNSAGLGGDMNVDIGPGWLPRQRVPARLLLTVRVAPAG